ncbi:helix-turn-helix domain-containing protein [Actinomadura sp. NAK00032]|uniref:helix-turn-helix domain-containing protein n=1 Tax=Actinomadura sp. NAK00032 TaxID=2742128 RepID=UPI0015919D44|nr:helix-turn-helix domain-containing protein [Actinomadura sp. NAK00032]QKW34117.1 helix-turn-helix domain-containing protein [Actinomadura sp. NAK00032]
MRANFEDAYRELAPAAARLLRLLSLPPGDDIGPAAAAALADMPESQARGLLETLAAHGLVAASGDRFRLPGPVLGFARERAEHEETEDGRNAALRRLLDHCLAQPPGAAEPGDLGAALLDRERWSEAAEVLGERLTEAEDEAARARVLAALGDAYLRAHRPVAAINFFGQALDIMRRRGEVGEQAGIFVHIADAARERGDHAAEGAALGRAAVLALEDGAS